MTLKFPTRHELKCTGCSFVIGQFLFLLCILVDSIDVDAYAVTTEEEVVALHNTVSSSKHRTEIEISVTFIWLAYPFLLIGLFGVKKFITAVNQNEPGEMFTFTAVQSYMVFLTIACVIIPALRLTTSAFEWSFHEYTPDDDFVPTGYYIQLYLIVFVNELIDCVAIADAVFMLSLVILPWFVVHFYSTKFKKLKAMLDPSLPDCLKNMQCFLRFFKIVHCAVAVSLFVVFCIVLFEFAESGFLSTHSKAKYVLMWSFVIKILMGVRMVTIGYSSKYEAIQKVFEDEGQSMLAGDKQNYKMDQIAIQVSDTRNTIETPKS